MVNIRPVHKQQYCSQKGKTNERDGGKKKNNLVPAVGNQL
jgi:hypothetical protein